MSGYYGAVSVRLLMRIADFLPCVRLKPISPGYFDHEDIPVHPDWTSLDRALGRDGDSVKGPVLAAGASSDGEEETPPVLIHSGSQPGGGLARLAKPKEG
jgi:hypothetical protein